LRRLFFCRVPHLKHSRASGIITASQVAQLPGLVTGRAPQEKQSYRPPASSVPHSLQNIGYFFPAIKSVPARPSPVTKATGIYHEYISALPLISLLQSRQAIVRICLSIKHMQHKSHSVHIPKAQP